MGTLTRRRVRITAAALVAAAGAVTGAAVQAGPAGAATQQPVDTRSTPYPGVTLYNGKFYAFTTGGFGL